MSADSQLQAGKGEDVKNLPGAFYGPPSEPTAPKDPPFKRLVSWLRRLFKPYYRKEEAYYAILLGSAWIDRDLAPEECVEIDSLIRRSRKLKELGADKRDALMSRVYADFSQTDPKGRTILVDRALQSFSNDRQHKQALFINAVDVAMSDGFMRASEKAFIHMLADKLDIEQNDYKDFLDVLCIKNQIPPPHGMPNSDTPPLISEDPLDRLSTDVMASKEEAFYTLLWCAVLIDGEQDEEEVRELQAIVGRSKSFKEMKAKRASEYDAMIANAQPVSGDREKLDELTEDACTTLREDPEIAQSVFTHCCDLVFADGRVKNAEINYLKELHIKLLIPEDLYRDIVEVITLKNKY